uniref:Replicase n=1 Tax=Agaricus bisporus virus 16 TaxID=1945746 RepID=A0A1Q1M952_9VIRU|nr:replicase [Agaricus bisporus virus 16]
MSTRSNSPVGNGNALVAELRIEDAQDRLRMIEESIADAQKRLSTIKKDIQVSKFEADVKTYHFKGDIKCTNARHFVQVPYDRQVAGRQVTCRPRTSEWIFNEMPSYSEAKCHCERMALEWANKNQRPGTTADKWVALGSTRKGLGEATPGKPVRKVLPVRYTLTSEQHKIIARRFPTWTVYTEAIGTHDHPIAHTTTVLAAKCLFEEKLPRDTRGPPLKVLDINGSPAANQAQGQRLNLDITTTCKVITGRDEMRRVKKWGPQAAPDGTPLWHDLYDREIGAEGASITPEMFREYKRITMVHCLYYYSPRELLALLRRGNDDLVLEAIVHKFGGSNATEGSLNGGEQTWKRVKHDGGHTTIQQPNIMTGQTYEHPDNAWLFEKSEYVEGDLGLTWDINMFTDETFFISMKTFRPRARQPDFEGPCATCGRENVMVPPPQAPKPTVPPPRIQANTAAWLAKYSTAVIQVGDKYFEYTIEPELHTTYTLMRRRLDSKARTSAAYTSHCSMVETKIKGVENGLNKTFSFEAVEAIKKASFWVDVKESLDIDLRLFADHWKDSRLMDNLYKFGHHGTERKMLAVAIDAALQAGGSKSSTATAALAAMKALVTEKS